MTLRTRRWDDPREEGDGFRLLVCRYRPRALPRSAETWDAWWAELGPSRALHAAYYGKIDAPIPWEEYERRWAGLRERFGLGEAEAEKTEDLPAGIRQRSGLALATLHHPRVLFLDEPTAGADVRSRGLFWDLIQDEANVKR